MGGSLVDGAGCVGYMAHCDWDDACSCLDGKCFALAYASHRLTGWTIEGKSERLGLDPTLDIDPASAPEYAAHFWILAPNGRAVDVNGPCSRSDMIAAYGSAAGEVRVFDRISFEEFCEVDDDDPADTFWNDVEDAEDYLAQIGRAHV